MLIVLSQFRLRRLLPRALIRPQCQDQLFHLGIELGRIRAALREIRCQSPPNLCLIATLFVAEGDSDLGIHRHRFRDIQSSKEQAQALKATVPTVSHLVGFEKPRKCASMCSPFFNQIVQQISFPMSVGAP
jgi:hypothetical protein